MEKNAVPTIDLSDFPAESDRMLKACEEKGCFRVINHNIPSDLMLEMKKVVISRLDLPMEVKNRNRDVIVDSGYMSPSQTNPLYESLSLYDIVCPQAVQDFCYLLDASPYQREVISSYAKAIHELAIDLLQKLAESMGLSKIDLFEGLPAQFRMNKYNFTPETVGSAGVQIHTDSGFLTILQDDENVGGLEVMDRSGEFLAVDPLPGSFVVNLGDVATVWSNGRLCNVKHRVQCRQAAIRISIATFLLGPMDSVVEAPSELLDNQHPRLYVPFMYPDYRKLRLETNLQAGEALELLRTNYHHPIGK